MLNEETALRSFARMMNTLDARHLEAFLGNDFHYASQEVWEEIASKKEYLEYIRPKLETIRGANSPVKAEMGAVIAYGAWRPCAILIQHTEDETIGRLVLAKVDNNQIQRLDMCAIPSVEEAQGTGEFPD